MAQAQQPKNLEETLQAIQQLSEVIQQQNELINQLKVALQLQHHRQFAKHQIAYFHYAPTRSGKVISDVLTPDYAGAVMCDGYRGYGQEQLPKATFGSCLIHIRRPFIELVKGLTLKNNAQATQTVKLLSRVFYREKNLRYKTLAEKKAQRR